MSRRKRRTHYRAFLEPPARSVDSYVHLDISPEGDWINLKIADCNRSVNLGFDPSYPKIALPKIAKLRKALDMVEDAILTHTPSVEGGGKILEESGD